MRLYIIGNGFDMAHNLPTSYEAFCNFMKGNQHNDYERLGHLFSDNPDWLWSDFENNLAKLNIEKLVSERVNTWINLKGYEIENTFDEDYTLLKTYFMEWVIGQLKDLTAPPIYDLSRSDLYITFNYTDTLNSIYNIPESHVLHIHGNCTKEEALMPIVGHGVCEKEIEEKVQDSVMFIRRTVERALFEKKGVYGIEEMTEVIRQEVVTFLNSLRKTVDDVIRDNIVFFNQLTSYKQYVSEVIILGHSLASVDIPYFKKVEDCIDPDAIWSTDYFPHDEDALKKKLWTFKETMGFDAKVYERHNTDTECEETEGGNT